MDDGNPLLIRDGLEQRHVRGVHRCGHPQDTLCGDAVALTEDLERDPGNALGVACEGNGADHAQGGLLDRGIGLGCYRNGLPYVGGCFL